MKDYNNQDLPEHTYQKKSFALAVFLLEIVMVFFYGFYVRVELQSNIDLIPLYYVFYQDVNVMMLIGFGFLMTFIRSYSWSSLAYTFFINAVVVQLYILMTAFWQRVFFGGFGQDILINERSLTTASYCVAAVLISFGAFLGRVDIFDLLIIGVIQCILYSLNEQIVYSLVRIYDAGGSTVIHTFGAYYGLMISWIIAKKARPMKDIKTSYNSNIFAFVGTLFLWMFWPSFNAGFAPVFSYEKLLIIFNTVISLTGSVLSTFMITSLLRKRFHMEQILNATLAGGVVIGAPSGVLTNPGGAMVLGFGAGAISSLGFLYLSEKLVKWINLHDSCGVHNLHGIPGLLGGISSAIIIAAYGSSPLSSDQVPVFSLSPTNIYYGRSYTAQAGIQIAGTFISLAIGLLGGVVAGFIIYLSYNLRHTDFYDDQLGFSVPDPNSPTKARQELNSPIKGRQDLNGPIKGGRNKQDNIPSIELRRSQSAQNIMKIQQV